MADPNILPEIRVDNEIDDEGGSFIEENLSIGTTPSTAKITIEGDDDLSVVSIDDPEHLSEGLAFEVEVTGVKISKTIYDNRQRAKRIIFTASFNSENSDRYMSLIDGKNYEDGHFQNMTYNDIIDYIVEKTRDFPGSELVLNTGNPKLNVYAGEFKFDNNDVVTAITQVLERAGNFSWWLKRNAGPPNTSVFTNEIEILDLGEPEQINIAVLGQNIYSADFTGSEDSYRPGVLVKDGDDDYGSKMQFGDPTDYGRTERGSETLNPLGPLVSRPIIRTDVPETIQFSAYDINAVDFGQGRRNLWTFPSSPNGSGDFLTQELQISVNKATAGTNRIGAIFEVPEVHTWPNAQPPIVDGRDFVKIERKLLTHPNVDLTIETYFSSHPTLSASETFHEKRITENGQVTNVISPGDQFATWKASKRIKGITDFIDQGKDSEFASYEFLQYDYLNNEGRDAKKVQLVLKPRPTWTSLPEYRIDFDRGYIFVPSSLFYLLGNWSPITVIKFTNDPDEAAGASTTTPKVVLQAKFEDALQNSAVRIIGVLSRPHRVAKKGDAPYAVIRKGDYKSTNVPFNAAGIQGFIRSDGPFNDFERMEHVAEALYQQNLNKTGARGRITIYPGDQSVFPGRGTNGGVIINVKHTYVPYFKTDISLTDDRKYYDLSDLAYKRELNQNKHIVDLNNQSIRTYLSRTGAGGSSGSSGAASLVPPHTHSDQFSGGTRLGDIIVNSITIEGDSKKGNESEPAINFNAGGEQGTLDVVFDPDKGKFVSQTSLFIDKRPDNQRVPNAKSNESTQFTDVNRAQARAPSSGYLHNLFDIGLVGTEISRVCLNIVPKPFEPLNEYSSQQANLRNYGGDRLFITDSQDRAGYLGTYTSNPVHLISRFSSGDTTGNSERWIRNSNTTPISMIGVAKPAYSRSTRVDENFFNNDVEVFGFASMIMDQSSGTTPAFKVDLDKQQSGNQKTTVDAGDPAIRYEAAKGSGYWLGYHWSDQQPTNLIELLSLRPLTSGTVTTKGIYRYGYYFNDGDDSKYGFGQQIGGVRSVTAEKTGSLVGALSKTETIARSNGTVHQLVVADGLKGYAAIGLNAIGNARDLDSGFNQSLGTTGNDNSRKGASLGLESGILSGKQYGFAYLFASGDTPKDAATGTENAYSGSYGVPVSAIAANPEEKNVTGIRVNHYSSSGGIQASGTSGQSGGGGQGSSTFPNNILFHINSPNKNTLFYFGPDGMKGVWDGYQNGSARVGFAAGLQFGFGGGWWWGNYVFGNQTGQNQSSLFPFTHTFFEGGASSLKLTMTDSTMFPISSLNIDLSQNFPSGNNSNINSVYNYTYGTRPGSGSAPPLPNGVAALLSMLVDAVLSLMHDLQSLSQVVDNILHEIDSIWKKIKEIQAEQKKNRKVIINILIIIIIVTKNKKKQEGEHPGIGGTTPGGTGTSTPQGGTTGQPGPGANWGNGSGGVNSSGPSTTGGVTGTPGWSTPSGPTSTTTGGAAGGGANAGGENHPGGGTNGKSNDNKNIHTGMTQGASAVTGNATQSAGSGKPANVAVLGLIGSNPVYTGRPTKDPILTPSDNSEYRQTNPLSIPIGETYNPETLNPDTYLVGIPEVSKSSAATLWRIGGGGGLPNASTGPTTNPVAPVTKPGDPGWQPDQDIRSILQLASRTPTVDLDAAGRWTIVGGDQIFPTMYDAGGRIAISDDVNARVNIGGLIGTNLGVLKTLAGIEARPELIVSKRSFGLVVTDGASNKFISNNFGAYQAAAHSDGSGYYITNPSETPIFGGVIGTMMNRINRYDSRTSPTNTGLFVSASGSVINANSSIEESIIAIDSCISFVDPNSHYQSANNSVQQNLEEIGFVVAEHTSKWPNIPFNPTSGLDPGDYSRILSFDTTLNMNVVELGTGIDSYLGYLTAKIPAWYKANGSTAFTIDLYYTITSSKSSTERFTIQVSYNSFDEAGADYGSVSTQTFDQNVTASETPYIPKKMTMNITTGSFGVADDIVQMNLMRLGSTDTFEFSVLVYGFVIRSGVKYT